MDVMQAPDEQPVAPRRKEISEIVSKDKFDKRQIGAPSTY
jgi:hypothetical protein